MVGEAGLKNELANAGIEAEGLEDARLGYSPGSITRASLNPDIGAVVVGLDRNLCYYKVSKAVAYIKYGEDVKFVSTNPDGSFPDGDVAIAGGGSIGAMIAYAAGRAPDAVTGKPGKMMMDMALAMNGLARERTIMIGDRLDTDIAFGIAGGLQSTLHVLTGVNSLEDSNNADDSMKPDYYTPSLGHLVDLL
jgi:ribonucleotide monophosphatase NagD (HAD superfamily)